MDESCDSMTSYIRCKVCGFITKMHVVIYEDIQYWHCEADHVLVMDGRGKELLGIETKESTLNWRHAIDYKRNVDYNPQAQSWNWMGEPGRQRRVGGRGRHHFNFYGKDESE